jgi:hypothetical protein
MKTAMQELIDSIRFTDKECYATMFNEGIFDKALEKEKEGIICAWNDSKVSMMSGEQYFEETYNQNK